MNTIVCISNSVMLRNVRERYISPRKQRKPTRITAQAQMEAFEQAVSDFGGRLQIVEGDVYVIELTDTPDSINYFIEELQDFHIREISRTGGVALELSRETVY